MDKLLLGGPPRPAGDPREFQPLAIGKADASRINIQDQEPAVILDRILRCCLAEPCAQVDFADPQASVRARVDVAHARLLLRQSAIRPKTTETWAPGRVVRQSTCDALTPAKR